MEFPLNGWLASLVSLAFVMSVTPGPNNLLFAASGSRVGFLRSLPTIGGMLGGFFLVIGASCVGIGALVGDSRGAQVVLTSLAAGYMTWIAVKLWTTERTAVSPETTNPISWHTIAALQGLNPKTWLTSVAFVSGSLGANSPGDRWLDVVGIAIFLAVVTLSASLWTLFGATLRGLLIAGRLVIWNRFLSVLSLTTAVGMTAGLIR